jgi:hypothetical protein
MVGTYGVVLSLAILSQTNIGVNEKDPRCGSDCLYLAVKALGNTAITYDTLVQSLGSPSPTGYSMARLADGARSFGLFTQAVETNTANLRKRKENFTCIALLKYPHFVLVYKIDDDYVYLINSRKQITIPVTTFEAMWSQKALLISNEPLRQEESLSSAASTEYMGRIIIVCGVGSALAVVSMVLIRRRTHVTLILLAAVLGGNVGCVRPSQIEHKKATEKRVTSTGLAINPVDHDLGEHNLSGGEQELHAQSLLTNTSANTIAVKEIQLGCACTKVGIDKKKLAPGEVATLLATIDFRRREGDNSVAIKVITDETTGNDYTISYKWKVSEEVVADPVPVLWQRLIANEDGAPEKNISIRLRHLDLCKECIITSIPTSAEIECRFVPASVRRSLTHVSTASDRSEAKIGDLFVKIDSKNSSPGYHRATIPIVVRCKSGIRARTTIPVIWTIGTPIAVIPARLSFGLSRKRDTVGRTLILSAQDSRPFRITGVAAKSIDVDVDGGLPIKSAAKQVLSIHCKMPAVAGAWADELCIETDHPEMRRVQVFCSGVCDEQAHE